MGFGELGVVFVGDFGSELLHVEKRADELCGQNLHMKEVLMRFNTDYASLKFRRTDYVSTRKKWNSSLIKHGGVAYLH